MHADAYFVIHDVPLPPFVHAKGWLAVSETILALDPDARRGGYKWLEPLQYERVGKSIRLYYAAVKPRCAAIGTHRRRDGAEPASEDAGLQCERVERSIRLYYVP